MFPKKIHRALQSILFPHTISHFHTDPYIASHIYYVCEANSDGDGCQFDT